MAPLYDKVLNITQYFGILPFRNICIAALCYFYAEQDMVIIHLIFNLFNLLNIYSETCFSGPF